MELDLQHVEVEHLRRRLSVKWQLPGAAGRLAAWAAEMDFPVAEPIREVIAHALQHDDFGYPQPPHAIGLPALFARRMSERYGWLVDESRVELLSDVLQGVCLALMAYTEPGDGALLQTPIYGPFLDTVSSMGRRSLLSPLQREGGRYVADLDHLRRVSEGARILLLCHPHNPTGRVFTRAELDAIAQLALERDWYVVSDEIHADLTFPDSQFVPFASLGPEIAARTVTLTSASKAFNIAGLRCAVACFGSAELHQRFNQRVPPRARGGVGILGQHCALAAWRAGGPWLAQVMRALDDNRTFVFEQIARELPGVSQCWPQATYLHWLDFSALDLPQMPAAFFRAKAAVVLSDGAWFGSGYERCVRLNYATSRAILEQMVGRIITAVRER